VFGALLAVSNQEKRQTACDFQSLPTHNFKLEDVYQLQEILGEGAFAKVYRATRRGDSSSVALKAIHQRSYQRDDFERESNALSILSQPGHSNICRLYDQHQDGDKFYLAMELIGGGEVFEHLIQKGAFSEQDASKFLRQFAEALSYIHAKGLVHGDLKPENLMMDSWDQDTAQLKVVDFGSTVLAEENQNDNLKRSHIGRTVAYSPPEVHDAVGQHHPTPAVDMFAAGCIIYCILTGSHPFDPTGQASEQEIVEAILNSSTEFPEDFFFDDRIAGLSQSAIDVMRKLLHPNPNERMTSEKLQRHPWVQGLSASAHVMKDSDQRLVRFGTGDFEQPS
jgi:serine/threonine protein kinase